MNRTKNFFYNSLSTGILQIFVLISGFIVPRFMLQYYGSDTNGLVSSINQFITYFRLIEAGLASAAIYALYKPLAEKNQNEINSILSATKKFYYKTGTIFSFVILVFAVIYSLFVKSETLSPLHVGLLILALSAEGVFDYFAMAKYRVLMTADQKIYILSLANIVSTVLYAILVCALAYFRVNILIVRYVALLSILARSLILFIFTKRKYNNLDYKAEPNNKALNKRWDALYLQILGAIQVGTPIIIATFLLSLKEVSVFSIYNMVVAGIGGILGIFISGLSSSFGDVIVKGDKEILKQSYRQFEFIYYKIIAFFYGCTLVLILSFVKIYTKGIEDANYIMPLFGSLIVLNSLFYNLKTPQGMLVISAGMFKETRVQTTIQGAIAVVCSLVFGIFWGLEGIIAGMILSNLYRCVDLFIFVPKKITETKISSTLKQVMLLILNVGVIYIPFIFIKIKADSYLKWFIYALCIAAYAFIVTILISLLTDFKLSKKIMGRFKNVFIKAKNTDNTTN